MPQYLLSVHGVDGAAPPPPDVMQKMFADVNAFNDKVRTAGAWVFAGGLQPPHTATVVRVEDGKATLTDGPFVEAKEHIGGFWILEAKDLDAALSWAKEATVACRAPVEVRPFQEIP